MKYIIFIFVIPIIFGRRGDKNCKGNPRKCHDDECCDNRENHKNCIRKYFDGCYYRFGCKDRFGYCIFGIPFNEEINTNEPEIPNYCSSCSDGIGYDYNEEKMSCLHYKDCSYSYYYFPLDSFCQNKTCLGKDEICPDFVPYETISTKECVESWSYEELRNLTCKPSNIQAVIESMKETFENEMQINSEFIRPFKLTYPKVVNYIITFIYIKKKKIERLIKIL